MTRRNLSIFAYVAVLGLRLSTEVLAQSPTSPTFLYERAGTAANQNFGAALACVDNFAAQATRSVAIGFPGLAVNSGFIVVDGATGTTVQFSDTTSQQDARLGAALSASAGIQLAGNGLSEVLVGFPSGSPGISPSGVTAYGGPDGVARFSSSNASSMVESLGFKVCPLLDDLDGDGLNDFIYSSPLFSFVGAVFVDDINQSGGPINTYLGSMTDENFGMSIDSIQDMDGGGKRDLLVGATGRDGGAGFNSGAVVIVSSENGTLLAQVNGDASNDFFGYSVVNVGDVDGDGVEDFLVGAPVLDDNPRPGYARLFKGVVGGNPVPLCTVTTGVPMSELGAAVARVGDLDGDFLIEFAIGAPNATPEGSVFISHYDVGSGTCPIVYTLDGSIPGERFGEVLMGSPRPDNICDLNGDNIADFGVGAPAADLSSGPFTGRAVFFRGNFPMMPTPTATPTVTPTPSVPLNASMQFKIRQDGQLDGAVTLNRAPVGSCDLAVFGRTSLRSRTDLGPVIQVAGLKAATAVRSRFRGNGLRRAVCDLSGQSYSIHLLARVSCEGREFFSPVRARQMSCGLPPPLVRSAWEQQLIDKVQFTLAAKRRRARQRARHSKG